MRFAGAMPVLPSPGWMSIASSSSPEDFARAFVAETLRAVLRFRGDTTYVGGSDERLRAAAAAVHPDLEPFVTELVAEAHAEAHGRLLSLALRFPAEVSARAAVPLLMMLDEFQDITRLRAFRETNTLLGVFRAALDRPGRVCLCRCRLPRHSVAPHHRG